MTFTNPYSRQQPIPGRGGPGDLGSPATWERRPLAQVATLNGERSGSGTIVMAKGETGFFSKTKFEPVGFDFSRAINAAADRAGKSSLFGGAASHGVLQAFDGQLYITPLATQSGVGFTLEGESGFFNPVISQVSVAKLHPALQAIVGKRVMVDLRADSPQPIPAGGTQPYQPIPGTPQPPSAGYPNIPGPWNPSPYPTPYPQQPYPPAADPAAGPAPAPAKSWWDRINGR